MKKYAIFTTGPRDAADSDALETECETLLDTQCFGSLKEAKTALKKYSSSAAKKYGPGGSVILETQRVYVREYTGSRDDFSTYMWPFAARRGKVVYIKPYEGNDLNV